MGLKDVKNLLFNRQCCHIDNFAARLRLFFSYWVKNIFVLYRYFLNAAYFLQQK